LHHVTYTLRTIAPEELPTAPTSFEDPTPRALTEQELLDRGLVRLHDDLFECVEQSRRDPETLAWAPHGPPLPGTPIAAGPHRQRYGSVPAAHAPHVFRAQVIRSDDPASPAAAVAAGIVAEVAAELATAVGDVNGAPLLDLTHPDAVLEAAQRLVEIPGNGVERTVVPMIAVDAGDVVEADGIIPHRWHGESLR
jgi:hypothetical protein